MNTIVFANRKNVLPLDCFQENFMALLLRPVSLLCCKYFLGIYWFPETLPITELPNVNFDQNIGMVEYWEIDPYTKSICHTALRLCAKESSWNFLEKYAYHHYIYHGSAWIARKTWGNPLIKVYPPIFSLFLKMVKFWTPT